MSPQLIIGILAIVVVSTLILGAVDQLRSAECRYCCKQIDRRAVKCPYCQSDLSPVPK
ncbi:MAG: hypothetical protein ACLQGP_03015 [Isosphaeraceae bacterium]